MCHGITSKAFEIWRGGVGRCWAISLAMWMTMIDSNGLNGKENSFTHLFLPSE